MPRVEQLLWFLHASLFAFGTHPRVDFRIQVADKRFDLDAGAFGEPHDALTAALTLHPSRRAVVVLVAATLVVVDATLAEVAALGKQLALDDLPRERPG
eukprot:7163082-Prymnesium_polylepis.1